MSYLLILLKLLMFPQDYEDLLEVIYICFFIKVELIITVNIFPVIFQFILLGFFYWYYFQYYINDHV